MKLSRILFVTIPVLIILTGLSNGKDHSEHLSKKANSLSVPYDVVLSASNSYIIWRNQLKPYMSLNMAMFCSNPNATVMDTTNFSSVDSVFFNDKPLLFRYFWYVDTTFSTHLSNPTWRVYSSSY